MAMIANQVAEQSGRECADAAAEQDDRDASGEWIAGDPRQWRPTEADYEACEADLRAAGLWAAVASDAERAEWIPAFIRGFREQCSKIAAGREKEQ